jgi:soluble lytic murein transglycosylase-like protein
MANGPGYVSQQELPGGGVPAITVPHLENPVPAAAARMFGAAGDLADAIGKASEETASLNGLADYYQKLDGLKRQYQNDPDPTTAPRRFQADVTQLQQQTMTNAGLFNGPTAARMKLHMVTKGITDLGDVWSASKSQEKDATEANLATIGRQAFTDWSTAETPVRAEEARSRYHEAVDGAANGLLITKTSAALKKIAFDDSIDHAGAMRVVATNPTAAIGLLQDPNQFKSLTPVERETYVEHARNAADKRGVDAAIAAGGIFPASASMIAGKIIHPGDTDQLFDRVIVGLESDGKNLPPNAKGAFGPAQLLPGTARDMAKAIGRDDLAKLDDKGLTDALMEQPALNRRLGLEYWHQLERRYNGNVPLMMAGYNAGPGNADKWKAEAEKKFGPDFTADQLQSIIPFAETRDYIAKGHAMAGARLDAFGVSPNARYEMGIKIGHELTEQQNQRNRIIDQIASVAMADDPVIGMLKQGVDVDPQRIAATRGMLVDAAATGSVENIKRLRDFDFAISVQPKIAQAYRLPFPALDAMVNAETARVNAPGASPTWQETHQLDLLKKTRDEIAKARDENPTGLIARAGIDAPVPIDPAAEPNDPNFRAALGRRGAQAITAQKLYSGSAVALSPAEQDALRERYTQAGPNERFGLLKAFADTLPDNAYLDTVKKITGNADSGLLAAHLLRSRPALARELLDGEALMKTKDVGEKADLARTALSDTVGGQIFPDPAQQGAAVDAALKIDIARRAAAGTLYDRSDMSGVGKAFEDVAGEVVKRNGARTVAVPGMKAGVFTGILDHLDERDLASQGGAYGPDGRAFDASWLGRHAQLKPLGVGSTRYAVILPSPDGRGAPVMTASEIPAPLIFDMSQLADRFARKEAAGHLEFRRALAGKAELLSPRDVRQEIRDDLATRFPGPEE